MKDNEYFLIVNEEKKEVYFVSKNQHLMQRTTLRIYKKYDKHIRCVKRTLTKTEIRAYKKENIII